MMPSNLDGHFGALWSRLQSQRRTRAVNPSELQTWASARGLSVLSAEKAEIGSFHKTPGILLTVAEGKAFFPDLKPQEDKNWQERNTIANENLALWKKVEWFSPLWVPTLSANKILADIKNRSKEESLKLFDYHTSTIYTISFKATCITQIFNRSNSLRDIAPLAREAFLAFYSGYRAASIAALIPAIEGSIVRMASNDPHSRDNLQEKIKICMEKTINKYAKKHFSSVWIPDQYLKTEYLLGEDEIVFFLESFRLWLQESFFARTDSYTGLTWLNRHLFAHGVSSDWQQAANFSRLIVALATISAVEAWYADTNSYSTFFPEINEDSELLWQEALFQAEAQMVLKRIEEERYHQHGRLVPEMPTDDGVLLRKAILTNDCINDLVRPLRNAGWSVEVGDPDEKALYVTVVASSKEEELCISLLYSCGTDNKIYRSLAEKADVILYRGAPYHQSQFAYGIDIHVGPVTGWQPPAPKQPLN